VQNGFVAVVAGGQHRLEAYCGDRPCILDFLERRSLPAIATTLDELEERGHFTPTDGFWLTPLYNQAGDVCLGVLGLEARAESPDLTADEGEIATLLIDRAQEALEDRYLQQNVFETLSRILPDIERLHRWQGATRYAGSPPMQAIDSSPVYSPEFQQWVRDALSHYWGGPKLTESPLLSLRVVGDATREQGGGSAQGLRTVLSEAIERLRPDGERKMTAAEWILYNILELKFIRGLRVRDVAGRLAMSESDLYRKQRVAIAEVARVIAELEQNGSEKTEDVMDPAVPVAEKSRLDKRF
jgi:hypothetical protein